MDYYFEKQQTNREKAKRAFCEFFDCFIEADPEFILILEDGYNMKLTI